MFHLRSVFECLERVMNNEKTPYPPMDRKKCFKSHCIYYIIKFSIKKSMFFNDKNRYDHPR